MLAYRVLSTRIIIGHARNVQQRRLPDLMQLAARGLSVPPPLEGEAGVVRLASPSLSGFQEQWLQNYKYCDPLACSSSRMRAALASSVSLSTLSLNSDAGVVPLYQLWESKYDCSSDELKRRPLRA